ncbi:MAG: DNA helicase RecQ [Schleiferiaceae bacterium]|nr:DNA helicase RecQ [Schleiferiaceae bacterium]
METSTNTTERQDPKHILKKYFGYDAFRPMQEEIISHVLDGGDALVLMPTGGGKSLCFQIPALAMPGVCIVISPLIALMKDQVDTLKSHGISAAALNSSYSSAHENEIINACQKGEIKLLYLSPEKAVTLSSSWWQSLQVNLIAIDEAHCISSWGHDFRPEYTQLKWLKKQLPNVPILALTATAENTTRKDIVKQLELPEPKIFVSSFNRPNLSLAVRTGLSPKERREEILNFLRTQGDAAGIIYCLSRKNTEDVRSFLNSHGIAAAAYHAGLSSDERSRIQGEFITDKTPVVCATIAFGMGIDKSNVRFVIHYNLPKNMEGYYQEIGRAGRDGLPSKTILFYSYPDVQRLLSFIHDGANEEINLEKLKWIQSYSESNICRRRILLSYFGENLQENCGNCDVCANPPKLEEGTTTAQMALSAIVRMGQKANLTQVVQVLRGNSPADIREKNWHQIKTFGVGRNISSGNWNRYLMQLLQLALLEMVYDENYALRVTTAGWDVLKGNQTVQFTIPEYQKIIVTKTDPEEKPAKLTKEAQFRAEMKAKRKEVAASEDVPAYVVFSDKTLEELLVVKPITLEAWETITGISQFKAEKYAHHFIDIIKRYRPKPRSGPGTHMETLRYFKEGKTIEEIAQLRELSIGTIIVHLERCINEGESVDLTALVKESLLADVLLACEVTQQKAQLRPLFDTLEEKYSYDELRLAMIQLKRDEKLNHIPDYNQEWVERLEQERLQKQIEKQRTS